MAVFFPSNKVFGRWAFNTDMTVAAPAPTEMYYYPEINDTGEGGREWGFFDKDGTYVDNALLNALQATTTDADMASAVGERDDDVDSPYKGHRRIKWDMS